MTKSNLKLKINELTGDYEIIHNGFSWISDGRAPYLHCFGTGLSKIGTDNRTADTELLDDENLKKEISRVKPLCDLQARLYNKEMIKHEFLGSYRRQKTIYSDGTTIIIDLDKNTYEIR